MANISDAQRNELIMQWLNDGASLSDVQKRLANECDIRMTYMDLRMLTADLEVSWEAQDKKAAAARPKSTPAAPSNARSAAAAAAAQTPGAGSGEEYDDPMEDDGAIPPEAAADNAMGEEAPANDNNGTVVEVSKLVRPGCSMSGSVKFGSGASGEWFLDPYGRVGFELAEGSAKPTPEDMKSFQSALYKALGY